MEYSTDFCDAIIALVIISGLDVHLITFIVYITPYLFIIEALRS